MVPGIMIQTAALRFFYRKVLRRPLFADDAPLPKVVRHQTTHRAQPGRSRPAHRSRLEPSSQDDPDDALLDRHPPVAPAESAPKARAVFKLSRTTALGESLPENTPVGRLLHL